MNELADSPPDPRPRIKKLALNDVQNLEQAAAVLETNLVDAEAFLTMHASAIKAEATRALLAGHGSLATAHRLVHMMLARIEAELPDMDVAEISNAIKHPIRVIENAEKTRLAEKDKYDNLPIFHIHIGRGPDIVPLAPSDVIDVTPRLNGGGQ